MHVFFYETTGLLPHILYFSTIQILKATEWRYIINTTTKLYIDASKLLHTTHLLPLFMQLIVVVHNSWRIISIHH